MELTFRDDGHDDSSTNNKNNQQSSILRSTIKTVKEGEEVILDCKINSNPIVTSINWFLNNNQLNTDPVRGIIISNSTLIIKYVRREIFQNGIFKCVAVNSEGRGSSNDVTLSILRKLYFVFRYFVSFVSSLCFLMQFYANFYFLTIMSLYCNGDFSITSCYYFVCFRPEFSG